MAERARRAREQADEAPRSGRRIGVWLITGTLVAAAGIGGYAVYRSVSEKINPQGCTAAQTGGDSVTLDNAQAANAATIAAVGRARGVPERAVVIALATARQESKLRNLTYGDRDSIGLFQQRPSMGWGSPEQIGDPVYAAGKFYSELLKVNKWDTLEVGVAAQQVQRSADKSGASYTQWAPMATVLAAALTGDAGSSLTCTTPDAKTAVETLGADGLTPRAKAVGTALVHAYGAKTTTTNTGQPKVTGSADGLTVSIPVAAGADDLQRSYARWAVAQAQALNVDRVAYADQVWTRDSGEWKTSKSPVNGLVDVTVSKGS